MSDRETKNLSDAIIRKLTPPASGYTITWDAIVGGFGCRVTARGTKAFILDYRVKGSGKQRRITLGHHSSWSTTSAREEAKRLRREIDGGADPRGDVESDRAAPTMADLIERFRQEHLPRRRRGTAVNYEVLLRRYIEPAFKHHKVTDVTFSDVDRLHRRVTKTAPYMANRMVAVLSSMFTLSIRWGMRADNPASHIERNPEVGRKRYLSGEELSRLTEALTAHPDRQAADIIRMLLLTGSRSAEVFGMRWSALDLTRGVWAKPAASTKQKADHIVPLSAPARQLLTSIRAKQKKPGAFVFPSTGKTGHIVDIVRAWRTICADAGISGLRVHDLRHSFASQLASAGASLPLIGALLGHSNPTTTHRYAHLFDDPQRAAVEKVAAIIDAAGKNTGENVETFPVKGGRHGR